jgi:hypothetical protein
LVWGSCQLVTDAHADGRGDAYVEFGPEGIV